MYTLYSVYVPFSGESTVWIGRLLVIWRRNLCLCVCMCVCVCVIADARVSVCANRDDRKVKCNSLGGPFLF